MKSLAVWLLAAAAGALLVTATTGCDTLGGSMKPVVRKVVDKGPAGLAEETVTLSTEDLELPPPPPVSTDAARLHQAAAPKELTDEYVLGPGDVISFQSYDDPSLNMEMPVRYDGKISLPIVGSVEVAGFTEAEVEDTLTEAYRVEFRDPLVDVIVREAGSRVFYVMGDVARPAQYPYTRPLSVIEVINLAGGVRARGGRGAGGGGAGDFGQLTKAFIIRYRQGERQVIGCDLRDLAKEGQHASDVLVLPSDIVYVPEGVNLVYVLGAVGRPSVYQITTDMTFLELLNTAGGPVESIARAQRVTLMRRGDEGETELFLINAQRALREGADFPIAPGDIVYVPRKRLVTLQEIVGRINGILLPLSNLYEQAYDTYYTDERFDRLFEDQNDLGALRTLQNVRDAVDILGDAAAIGGGL